MRSNWKTAICAWFLVLVSVSVSLDRSFAKSAPNTANVPSRVLLPVDDTRLVQLKGNVHPMARPEFDRGLVEPALPMTRLVLVLSRSNEQEAALERFMDGQLEPGSANFHRWLSPEEFGQQYGPSDADMQRVTSWLQNQGFQIESISQGRVTIEFSGTAAQVQRAFHTEIHRYLVNGEIHVANVVDPSVPEALAPVVAGVASLNNFFAKGQHQLGGVVRRSKDNGKWVPVEQGNAGLAPQFGSTGNGGTSEYISPYDFAAIYNILPLWNASIDGTGQTIAIVGRSDVKQSDFAAFRSAFGLPAKTLNFIHNGSDPGIVKGDNIENSLDVEWSGAVAKGANITLVVSASTQTSDGSDLSASYIIDHKTAPIMSSSYGQCELQLGTTRNKALNSLWQQGAAEGISIFVSAGDQGSSGCDSSDAATPNAAQNGLAVNGVASTPYNVAVGGTDFNWLSNQSKYWNSTNDSHGASAKGYIPEVPWNGTCTSTIIDVIEGVGGAESTCNGALQFPQFYYLVTVGAGSGGKSACTTPSGTTPGTCSGGYAKPSWQTGTGVPNDGKRDLPDVSLFAASGTPASAFLFCVAANSPDGTCNFKNTNDITALTVGGTSASSPAMAGVMALVVQKEGSAQGLPNPALYKLAAKESLSGCDTNKVGSGNSCVFYDTTSGDNASVCITGSPNCKTTTSGDQVGVLTGYSAGAGYDLATGLGSINVTNLVNAWSSVSATPAVSLSPGSLTFSGTNVGSTSATQTVTLKNTGGATLTIASNGISIGGTNASSFLKTATTCGSTLSAGASCTVTVAFKPTVTGSLTARLSFADNAGGSPQGVNLSGTGTASASIALSPGSLSFPNTIINTTSEAETVSIKNTGTGTVTLHSISIGGTNPTSFLQLNTCGGTLSAGASCTVFVAFKPTSASALKATLSVSDTASGSPQSISLSGTGTSAPSVTLSSTKLTFAATTVGSVTEAQSVTLKNAGTATVKLNGISLTGTNASSFLQVNECGSTLSSGASCTVYVAFKPAAKGTLTANLSIADNGSASPQNVALTGTGK